MQDDRVEIIIEESDKWWARLADIEKQYAHYFFLNVFDGNDLDELQEELIRGQ